MSQDISNEIISLYSALNKEIESQIDVLRNTPTETYYEQAMIDYQEDQIRQQMKIKWLNILKSKLPEVQITGDTSLISNIQKEIVNTENYIQELFSDSPPNKAEMDAYFDKEVFEFYADIDTNVNEHIVPLMDINDVSYEFHTFPTGKQILSVDIDGQMYVVEQSENRIFYDEAENWIDSAAENPEEYYENPEKDFWADVGTGCSLYHMTAQENLPLIKIKGLLPMDTTRGISNRNTGSAVFTSDNPDDIDSYGDVLIEIDVGKMKTDGYMPYVGIEEPVQEAEIKNSLANAIGLYDYEAEHDSDLSPTTIIIYGPIPPKYLKFSVT